MSISYGLTLAGGIITLLGGIMASAFGALVTFFLFGVGAVLGIWGMIVGIMLIVSAHMMNSKRSKRTGSILGVIFGILGLMSFQGVVVGPILALAGGVIGLSETGERSKISKRK